jgi:hypothetical protein
VLHDGGGEVFVRKAKGAAEGVFDEGLGEAARTRAARRGEDSCRAGAGRRSSALISGPAADGDGPFLPIGLSRRPPSTTLRGCRCAIYVLLEHQSTFDAMMALRLLRYMVRIWEQCAKEHPGEALPVIVPVVLAQDAQEWRVAPRFSALLDVPEDLAPLMAPYLPDFRFELLQLARMPFEAIRGTPAGILILRAMKADRLDALTHDAVWDESLLAAVSREILHLLVRYIAAGSIDKGDLERKLQEIQNPQTRSEFMSAAQQYHMEGRQEGRREAKVEYILSVLEARFDSVPEDLKEAVRSIRDLSHLDTLFPHAIRTASLEEFAARL